MSTLLPHLQPPCWLLLPGCFLIITCTSHDSFFLLLQHLQVRAVVLNWRHSYLGRGRAAAKHPIMLRRDPPPFTSREVFKIIVWKLGEEPGWKFYKLTVIINVWIVGCHYVWCYVYRLIKWCGIWSYIVNLSRKLGLITVALANVI